MMILLQCNLKFVYAYFANDWTGDANATVRRTQIHNQPCCATMKIWDYGTKRSNITQLHLELRPTGMQVLTRYPKTYMYRHTHPTFCVSLAWLQKPMLNIKARQDKTLDKTRHHYADSYPSYLYCTHKLSKVKIKGVSCTHMQGEHPIQDEAIIAQGTTKTQQKIKSMSVTPIVNT